MKRYIQFLFLVGALAPSVVPLKGMNPETGEVSGLQEERVIDAESNIVFSTKEGELVVIPFKYLINQSKTLEDLVRDAGGSSEKIPINFSSKVFHFVKRSLQVSSLSDFVEADLDESVREFNVEDLIELANCATWLDYQVLMKAMVRIIAQRCNAHETKSPTEVLDDYKKFGLTDEFAGEVAMYLKKDKEKAQEATGSKIQLETSDERLVMITSEQAQFFKMITNLVRDFGSGSERIPLPNLSAAVLEKIIALLPLISKEDDQQERVQATLMSIKEATKEYGFQEIKELFEVSDYLASDILISVFATIIEQRFNDVKAGGDVTELVTMMQQLPPEVLYRITKDVTMEPFLMKIQEIRKIIPKKLIGHVEGPIFCSSFSPDGSMIATGSRDATARLWNIADGSCLQIFKGHYKGSIFGEAIWCLSFSPDGSMIATGSHDKTIRLWNVADGSCLQIFKSQESFIKCLNFSPDGSTIAAGYDGKIIRLWNIADGSCQTFESPERDIWCLSFSPDGSTIATGSRDGMVRLWNVADGSCLQVFRGHKEHIVKWLSFSPDGSKIATGSRDGTVRLWNVADGGCLRVFKGYCLRFSSDGSKIAVNCDKIIRLWDVADGSCLQEFRGNEEFKGFGCLNFSPDGLTIVAASSNDITATVGSWKLFDRELQDMLKQLTFEQCLLVKLCYEAYQQKKHFNFLANDYLREIYQSCPQQMCEIIDYFDVPDQRPWYKNVYEFFSTMGS